MPFPEALPPGSAHSSASLSSNNPFRNRAASPSSPDAFPSPTSPLDEARRRPQSRNPFVDQPPVLSLQLPGANMSHAASKSLSAEEIFPLVKSVSSSKGSHRPTRSQEEALRARKSGRRPGLSDSPQRKPPSRPRRNSESSVMDLSTQPITQEEMKMIEAKRLRDRQRRERDGRSTGRDTKTGGDGAKERSKSRRPSRRLDIIDQLDATSIYGTGLFHHDGPFDALNPHRNRQNSRRAPMQAFPKDSLNNSLGGAGPLNRNPDHAVFMGNGTDEAFRDYAGGMRNKNGYSYPIVANGETAIFDPVARGSVVHGDESHGLGTSTFLEGTPAARTAIARREAEHAQEFVESGGLQRKKSLAQRIRHINKGPRDFAPSGRMTNPEATLARASPEGSASAGIGPSDANPFFAEFGEETLTVVKAGGGGSNDSPPRRTSGGGLDKRGVMEAVEEKPTGIIGRMKSLKGARKTRTSEQGPGVAL
ncbi:hypothetical protein L249_4750 [Ophiocordyceps polyrhachis-furcata BCC 54312]|uniref:Pal1 cell morphology protein n=1 Tax=Ophiocordyceps polyrhachis-furcata BCC 54312 TaxID=1330021 RepID=A0A367L2C6_9HYPO|nr:hypothetical protein L249_4750 [Ophiocordyceps polyrhachis-furcata BCC 54312]